MYDHLGCRVLRQRDNALRPLDGFAKQCRKLALKIRSGVVAAADRKHVVNRDHLALEPESRWALAEVVKHIHLPGKPKSKGRLIGLHGEVKGAYSFERFSELMAVFVARHPVVDQKAVRRAQLGQRPDQRTAVSGRTGWLGVDDVGGIKPDTGHSRRAQTCAGWS